MGWLLMHTHTLAEWAAFLSLGVSGYAALSVPYFVFVDADLADFDPRPAVPRAVAATHQQLVYAGHDLNRAIPAVLHAARSVGHSSAEAWRDAAALVLLLTTSPKGALR